MKADQQNEINVYHITRTLPAWHIKLQQTRDETAKDKTLAILLDIRYEGLPNSRSECLLPPCDFCNFREDLTIENINHMRSIFAEHGIPSKLLTDNELQYNCREFRQFKEAYGLQHISSPVSSVERIYRVHGTDRENIPRWKKRGPIFRNTVKQNNTS